MTRSKANVGFFYRVGMKSKHAIVVWCGCMLLFHLGISLLWYMTGMIGLRDTALNENMFSPYLRSFVILAVVGSIVIVIVNFLNARFFESRRQRLRSLEDKSETEGLSGYVTTAESSITADEKAHNMGRKEM